VKHEVTLTIDTDNLGSYTDNFLSAAWHSIQASSATFGDPDMCNLAEYVGREIIRRWLAQQTPPLWNHQGVHIYQASLTRAGQQA